MLLYEMCMQSGNNLYFQGQNMPLVKTKLVLHLIDRSRIGLAMSQDGRNWARIEADHHTGALFDAGEEGEWDECLNGGPKVIEGWEAVTQ